MTELELYKFVQGKEIDWRGKDELLLWVPFYDLKKFTEMLGENYLCEGGEQVYLQMNCVCINLIDICDVFEIEPTNIKPRHK